MSSRAVSSHVPPVRTNKHVQNRHRKKKKKQMINCKGWTNQMYTTNYCSCIRTFIYKKKQKTSRGLEDLLYDLNKGWAHGMLHCMTFKFQSYRVKAQLWNFLSNHSFVDYKSVWLRPHLHPWLDPSHPSCYRPSWLLRYTQPTHFSTFLTPLPRPLW